MDNYNHVQEARNPQKPKTDLNVKEAKREHIPNNAKLGNLVSQYGNNTYAAPTKVEDGPAFSPV